jgi:hypothetical protein
VTLFGDRKSLLGRSNVICHLDSGHSYTDYSAQSMTNEEDTDLNAR